MAMMNFIHAPFCGHFLTDDMPARLVQQRACQIRNLTDSVVKDRASISRWHHLRPNLGQQFRTAQKLGTRISLLPHAIDT